MNISDAYTLTLAFGLCLTAVGCGSEAPPGANTTSATSSTTASTGSGGAATTSSTVGGPDTTATTGSGADDYYPMSDGLERVYYHSSKGGWQETVTLTDNGDGTFLENDTPNPDGERTESVLLREASGRVSRISKLVYVNDVADISVEYDPGFVRFDPAWLDLEPGESVTVEYSRTETPEGGAPDPTRARAHIYTSLGLVDLALPGITYNDCLQIDRKRAYDDVTGQEEDQQKQFWFAPGVGKVKEQTITGGDSYEELVP